MKFMTLYVFYVGVLALLELARRIISEISEGLSQGFASKSFFFFSLWDLNDHIITFKVEYRLHKSICLVLYTLSEQILVALV